jgi:hypothetical protein
VSKTVKLRTRRKSKKRVFKKEKEETAGRKCSRIYMYSNPKRNEIVSTRKKNQGSSPIHPQLYRVEGAPATVVS